MREHRGWKTGAGFRSLVDKGMGSKIGSPSCLTYGDTE